MEKVEAAVGGCMNSQSNQRRYLILMLSLGAYVGSLFLPVFEFQEHPPVTGFAVLALGWLGIFAFNLAWSANPAFGFALWWFSVREYRRAAFASSYALLVGLMSPLAKEWYFDEGRGTPIANLGSAFYLWMASFCILLVSSLWRPASNATWNPDSPENPFRPLDP